jgi:transposase InsO family protein
VHLAAITANPSRTWVCQQARNLAWSLADRGRPIRFLIHDRDSKFSRCFDEVFRDEGTEVIRTPIRAPRANAIAERFVGTARRECLAWILIVGHRQLARVLRTYGPTSSTTTATAHTERSNSLRPTAEQSCASLAALSLTALNTATGSAG